MTVHFIDGFDQYNNDKTKISQMWDIASLSSSSQITSGRFGFDYNLTGAIKLYSFDYIEKNFKRSFCEVKVGFAAKFNILNDSNGFLIFKSSSTNIGGISLNSSGNIIFHKDSEYIFTVSNLITQSIYSLNSNTWNYLEVYINTSGSQKFEVKVNGKTFIDYQPLTQKVNQIDVTAIKLNGLYSGSSEIGELICDDLYVKVANTLTGSTTFTASINDYLNSVIIKTAVPVEQLGATIDGFINETGITASVSNASEIFKSITTNDNDETYISRLPYEDFSENFYRLPYGRIVFTSSYGTSTSSYAVDYNFLNDGDEIKAISSNVIARNTNGESQLLGIGTYSYPMGSIEIFKVNGLTKNYKNVYKIYDPNDATIIFPTSKEDLINKLYHFTIDSPLVIYRKSDGSFLFNPTSSWGEI